MMRWIVSLTLLGSLSHGLVSRQLSPQRLSTTNIGLNSFFKKPEQPKEEEEEFEDKAYDADDPVEKIFSFFFGKREAAPMGMCTFYSFALDVSLISGWPFFGHFLLARFGPDRFPEQYPATKTEWAAPVATDDKEMARVRPLLKNTYLETRGLKLTYNSAKNGWNAIAFHKAVDKKGGALVVCTTEDGLLCGGYNPKGWVGYGEYRGSIAAFLFVENKDGTFTKLRKVGGAGLAQIDNPESGPSFGADSLVIPLGDNPRVARSKLGSYYERFDDGTNSLFGSSASVQLKDLKVYHGVYEEGEYIPFTDAEPFALTWINK